MDEITVPDDSSYVTFTFEVGKNAQSGEHYAAYFSSDTNTANDILAGTLIEERNSIGSFGQLFPNSFQKLVSSLIK